MTVIGETFWIGAYGIFVPMHIKSVLAEDGYNIIYRDGGSTNLYKFNPEPMNENIYKSKYAYFDNTVNRWYFIG
ncbi:hypothetical protein H012_gp167 [Acanthamoeba polyphaga moumouvirus]|uniref:Uncharacterized protein n=2 Tax=Moumouvirus TaxID=3080801 RepID=L7RDV9_9VIRU|nr:hypothetical protein H012_gp167 [Acanthamoeba polyphaga moumouvirus]AEX62369.1 hypothetical protein mv_R164 [Moumouvirus Monve]AGC02283.1 hypothetical protein Moumou_00765 [Acanthamoeba polyphaga moumouvirus]AQN68625.1 hypothetical protein [Saudi moumouvirus]